MKVKDKQEIRLGDLLGTIKTTNNGIVIHVDVDPGDGELLQE